MISMPIAILRFKWSDQAQAPAAWNDSAYASIFLPSGPWWGVARYWEDCSFNLIELGGSAVLPWRTHAFTFMRFNPEKSVTEQNDRAKVIQAAVDQVLAEGVSLAGYAAVVVVFPAVPGADAGSSSAINIGGGKLVGGALLNEGLTQDVIAHEIGHTLGLADAFGNRPDPTIYWDPYCVMSARFYANSQSAFALPADPSVPSVGGTYFSGMAPRPSGAMLYHSVNAFQTSSLVQTLPADFRLAGVNVRLHATDSGWAGQPIVVVAATDPAAGAAEKSFVLEYRRSQGWDRAFKAGERSGLGFVSPGIVIHSIRDGVDPLRVTRQLAVYEGVIPIPLTGDADFRLGGGRDLGMVVRGVAPDGRYVDLTIGGAALVDRKGVVASIPEWQGGDSELVESGIADVFVPPNCGTGRFHYQITRQESKFVLSARASGYTLPAFGWAINGVALPEVAPGTPRKSGSLQVPVNAEFPRPNQVLKQNLIATLDYDLVDNTLTLGARSSDGNFDLWVQVTSSEDAPGALKTPADERSAAGNLRVDGVLLAYGQDWHDAVARCWARYLRTLPSASIFRSLPKSDLDPTRFGPANFFGSRIDELGRLDPRDELAARDLIATYRATLPAVAGQLQAAFDAMSSRRLNFRTPSDQAP